MRLFLFLVILFASCSVKTPTEQIVGTWYYSNAETLGDNTKDDVAARAAFDKSQAGQKLRFTKDSSWRNYVRLGSEEVTVREGKYSLDAGGKILTISKDETVVIELKDDTLKIHSPDNAVFVWRRLP
jgi:hypothetical protein